jgi:4-diphosphocytidyl-2-C-methyl-D-erythritol kinase
MGGGLGGGSSDAATTLVALDRLWRTGFGSEALAELAPSLGADVPFFLFGTSAWVEGVGERLAAIDLAERWYVVLTPPVGVPTGSVFAAPELTRDTEPLKMADFSAQQQDRFKNDLEAVVIARFPEVRASLEWLRQHGKARMTGSGSCVFAEFDTPRGGAAVLDLLPAPMTGFVAKGLTYHPLRAQ